MSVEEVFKAVNIQQLFEKMAEEIGNHAVKSELLRIQTKPKAATIRQIGVLSLWSEGTSKHRSKLYGRKPNL